MTIWEALFLGLVQGLTEFLPVSSSGHLVITQFLLGVKEPGITFEVFVHFGTLGSIFWVFYPDIKKLVIAGLFLNDDRVSRKMLFLIIMGCIPTGIIGIAFQPFFVGLFDSILTVGIMLLVTGSILWLINWKVPGRKTVEKMKVSDALVVGLFQGFAIIPGISRSGSTISAALFRELNRETAIKYSFLLALPAILGATVLECRELLTAGPESIAVAPLALGTAVAFASGVFAIRALINVLNTGKLHYFSYYCWMVGSLVILWQGSQLL